MPPSISWTWLLIGLAGGLALFLYGLETMTASMKRSAGNRIRTLLAAVTRNRFVGLLVGALVTMAIQSSSATTVMLVGFVQAELMSFAQSLAVILGANIGTTITGQMIAFKLTDFALVLVALGFGLRMLGRTPMLKNCGDMLLGFGILFYGMKVMNDSMAPLRGAPEFIAMLEGLRHPLMGIVAGTLFTALVQSSSATSGMVIVLAHQGLMSLDAAIPVLLGANIGTCVTALLAGIGAVTEAKRVAVAHVAFNLVGVALLFFWIPEFVALVRSIGAALNLDVARNVANAHTLFNLGVATLFLPFIQVVARLVLRILPERDHERGMVPCLRHLDDAMISTPAIALELARFEIARMAKILGRMHRAIIFPFISHKRLNDLIYPEISLLDGIAMRERKINFLEARIRAYLLKVSHQQMHTAQIHELTGLVSLLDAMERIGDVVTKNMVPLLDKKQLLEVDFSSDGKQELVKYHHKIGKQLDRLREVIASRAYADARKIKKKKALYKEYDARMRSHHLQRLFTEQHGSVETHTIHMELLDAMKLINEYSGEVANYLLSSDAPLPEAEAEKKPADETKQVPVNQEKNQEA